VIAIADENGHFTKTLAALLPGSVEISAVGYQPLKKKFAPEAQQ
jgi:hypothetical protein